MTRHKSLDVGEQLFYTDSDERMFTKGADDQMQGKQREILEVIEQAINEQGYPPTVREIGEAVGLSSPASVQGHLRNLEAQGYVRRGSSKRRALELLRTASGRTQGRSSASRSVRLVGRVAAGIPLLAEENVEDHLDLPEFLVGSGDCFALRVTGSSMVKAGILDGDLVVVRQQRSAEDGDIVVAMLEDEATVKRLYREEDGIRLQPENDAMEPIYADDPMILGKVIGVVRRL